MIHSHEEMTERRTITIAIILMFICSYLVINSVHVFCKFHNSWGLWNTFRDEEQVISICRVEWQCSLPLLLSNLIRCFSASRAGFITLKPFHIVP